MTRKTPHYVGLKVLTSFNGMHVGDTAEVELDARVRAWASAGLVEVVERGEDPSGPGRAESRDDEREQGGAAGGEPAGGEPGEGFGTGAYGASA